MSRTEQTRKLAVMALLVAISVLLIYIVHFPIIPSVAFLEYDPADIPILIGALAYGPVAGIMLTVVASVIQGLTVSAGTGGLYGILMHIVATSTLVLVSSTIYRFRHTRVGAIIGLSCGVVAMGAIMMPANLIITPYFLGMPASTVVPMLPAIFIFNIIKAGVNSAITFVVYKTVSRHLVHGASWDREQAQTSN